MSLYLGEGITAKTGFGGGHLYPAHYVNLYRDGGKDSMLPMADATQEIKKALDSPELAKDVAFQGFMRYLKSMYPKDAGEDGRPSGTVLTPSLDSFGFTEGYTGPNVEVMGIELNAFQFAHFVDYVLTNTGLRSEPDSRIGLIDGLRGD